MEWMRSGLEVLPWMQPHISVTQQGLKATACPGRVQRTEK